MRTRVGITTLLIGLAIWVFVYKAAPKMPDFEVYVKTASRAAHAEPLYRESDGHFVFKYLPAFAVLSVPLVLIPERIAEGIWFMSSVGLLVALLALAVRLPVERRKSVRWLVLVTVISFAKFYAHELVLGQVNLLFAVIAVGVLLAMKSGREALAGGLVVLAIVVKPYAVLFVPWLAARRQVPSIVTALAGFATVLLLPALVYGWDGNIEQHRQWWRMVDRNHGAESPGARQRLARSDVLPLGRTRRAVGAAGARNGSRPSARGWRRVPLPARRTVSGRCRGRNPLTLMPLLSPQGWDYVFLIATPAIIFLANYLDLLPRPMRMLTIVAVATIAFSLFDIMGRAAYNVFMRLSIISLCFFVVIGGAGDAAAAKDRLI